MAALPCREEGPGHVSTVHRGSVNALTVRGIELRGRFDRIYFVVQSTLYPFKTTHHDDGRAQEHRNGGEQYADE